METEKLTRRFKLKIRLVSLWYKIPRLKVRVSLKRPRLDKRWVEWELQRKTHGFDERSTWDLSGGICAYISPRLKMFKEMCPCIPYGMTEEEWNAILDDMIFFVSPDSHRIDDERYHRGKELLFKHFNKLGW